MIRKSRAVRLCRESKRTPGTAQSGKKTGLQDNRGITLIELLMSFAVSAIVLAGLSYLLFMGLRLYDRNEVNARVQNEAQNALNLLTDHMLEAGGVCMESAASDANLQCILLDELQMEEVAAGYNVWYEGEAVIVRLADSAGGYVGKIYMVSFPIEGDSNLPAEDRGNGRVKNKLASGVSGRTQAAAAAKEKVLDYFLNLTEENQNAWLMAEHVTACEIVPADSVKLQEHHTVYEDGSGETQYYYTAPFGFRISLTFSVKSQTGESSRTVQDTVYVRNRLKHVYIHKDGSMKEYLYD